ncbi:hypothetical protein CV102_21870 [Natronococcus pandeyae]|uniref:Uncharacterized protein n=1 Tax=Natronococcus pandeyae TaxID=2055836 RepID=A0A8J8PZY2_9EURY|nr:hypothetical protein CV102_21870 [Natronococcus pandeyae]
MPRRRRFDNGTENTPAIELERYCHGCPIAVALSGFIVLANRYGYGPRGRFQSANRWLYY